MNFSNIFASYNLVLTSNNSTPTILELNNIPFYDFQLYSDSPLSDISKESSSSLNEAIENTKPSVILPRLIQQPKVSKNTLLGSDSFEKAFREAVKINPEVAKYKNFLVRTADRESKFNSSILNTAGAPYYGYFLMGQNEIRTTTGLSTEQFRNNPVLQILGAVKLYKLNLDTIKKLGVYDLCKSRGYSDDAIVTGAWMGGPGGVKKYITGKGDPSDSHWYGGKGGSSVGSVMNNWMKNG